MSSLTRCPWSLKGKKDNEILMAYHDLEWGVPCYDDRNLFELLILEGAQAGLSWLTILKKRENYRLLYENFNVEKVANYNSEKILTLLKEDGIVRNRLKISSSIKNAQAFIKIQKKHGSFSSYFWSFVGGKNKQSNFKSEKYYLKQTETSKKISTELQKDGFSFFGPKICYAFMQSSGMVNDHIISCFRYKEIERKKGKL